MQCNINSRGKMFRLIAGIIMLFLAACLGVMTLLDFVSTGFGLVGAVSLFLLGSFGVFEGWNGWCAVRALGFRTPI